MKQFLKLLCVAFFATTLSVFVSAAAPSLISESAVLIDGDTGQVLYDKAMHTTRYPASITKIATVITGLERGALSDKIIMSDEAVFSISRSSSHIALDVGEEITLEQASYAALMMSANDACNGIAEHVGGSIDNFVKMMNETMAVAGAKNTHFSNAHGLKDSNHYTTAYDMAMICRYAIKNESFRKIFGTYKYDMPANNKQPEVRHFVNQHEMISNPEILYDGIIGGKAGWTSEAHYTLVTAAERDGRTLIAVVMKSPRNDDKYTDTKALLDYGFDEFESVRLTTSDLPKRSGYRLTEPISLQVPAGVSKESLVITTTMENGTDYAVVSMPDGQELMRFPCSVAIDVSAKTADEIRSENTVSKVMWALCITVLIIIGLFALLVAAIAIRKEIYRARRRRRRRRR